MSLVRKTPGVDEEQVRRLTTFANQTTLAIEHARLYRDLREKGRQLEAASRHKSEFLANMSHELRTPLNAIIGFSEVLLDPAMAVPDGDRQQFQADILSSGKHLLSLINDILDLAKVEAGRMELQVAPFNLPLVIESAITLIREPASRHGIALTVSIDAALGEIVADERKVRQVLLNLLSNAVKFTPEGGRIAVTAGQRGFSLPIMVTALCVYHNIGICGYDNLLVIQGCYAGDGFKSIDDDIGLIRVNDSHHLGNSGSAPSWRAHYQETG